jgi:hypothetical protein
MTPFEVVKRGRCGRYGNGLGGTGGVGVGTARGKLEGGEGRMEC